MSIFAHSGCRRQSPVVVGAAVGANDGPAEGAGEGDSEGPDVGASVGDDEGVHVGASVFSQHIKNWSPNAGQHLSCAEKTGRPSSRVKLAHLAWLLQCASVVGAGVGTADGGHAGGGLFAIHSASLLSYVGGDDGFGVEGNPIGRSRRNTFPELFEVIGFKRAVLELHCLLIADVDNSTGELDASLLLDLFLELLDLGIKVVRLLR